MKKNNCWSCGGQVDSSGVCKYCGNLNQIHPEYKTPITTNKSIFGNPLSFVAEKQNGNIKYSKIAIVYGESIAEITKIGKIRLVQKNNNEINKIIIDNKMYYNVIDPYQYCATVFDINVIFNFSKVEDIDLSDLKEGCKLIVYLYPI
jgi:hypothetical protein